MEVREYEKKDLDEVKRLFYDTVHSVNRKDYDEKQTEAWAPSDMNYTHLEEALNKNYSLLAVEDGIIIGFGDIDESGYLDHLFVHKDYQGKGTATALCDRLETIRDFKEIETHASITARPFFEKRGYMCIKEQTVEIRGAFLTNFVMRKAIS